MNPMYTDTFEISDFCADRYGRMKPAIILQFAQEIAGHHCLELGVDYESLAKKDLFWAVTRHKVEISRLPLRGEKLRLETWPMPTTRVCYPRATVAYDEEGRECFRIISIWVLMNITTRAMVLPGKSGIHVDGWLRDLEPAMPAGLAARELTSSQTRPVRFSDLDRNGHMNNTRCLDWIADLMDSDFHQSHSPREFTVCYFSEAREGQQLHMTWDFTEEGTLHVNSHRLEEDKKDRIFAAKIVY